MVAASLSVKWSGIVYIWKNTHMRAHTHTHTQSTYCDSLITYMYGLFYQWPYHSLRNFNHILLYWEIQYWSTRILTHPCGITLRHMHESWKDRYFLVFFLNSKVMLTCWKESSNHRHLYTPGKSETLSFGKILLTLPRNRGHHPEWGRSDYLQNSSLSINMLRFYVYLPVIVSWLSIQLGW